MNPLSKELTDFEFGVLLGQDLHARGMYPKPGFKIMQVSSEIGSYFVEAVVDIVSYGTYIMPNEVSHQKRFIPLFFVDNKHNVGYSPESNTLYIQHFGIR